MQKKFLIDSSVYLSSLLPHDSTHQISRKFFAALQRETSLQIVLPLIVALEVINNVYRYTQTRQEDQILNALSDPALFTIVDIDTSFLQEIFLPHYTAFRLKTADSIIAVASLHHQATLVTWDKRLLRQTQDRLTTVTPAQVLEGLNSA